MLYTQTLGNPKGKKILFVHGLLGSMQDFKEVLPSFQNFHLFLIDLPGHGKSPFNAGLTKDRLHAEIKKLILTHCIDHAVGYSLGGRILMELDYQSSSLFKKTAILSSHLGLCMSQIKKQEIHVKKWLTILNEKPGQFLKLWYSQKLFKTLDKDKMIELREGFNKDAISFFLSHLNLTLQPNCSSHIIKNQDKYLLLAGREDKKYCRLYSKFSNAKIIENASHALLIEKPIECSQELYHYFNQS